MGTSSFAATNIDTQAITDHDGFIGLAVQGVHSLLKQRWLRLADHFWCNARTSLDGRNHGAAAREKTTGYRQQRITVDSDKVCAATNSQDSPRQFLIVKMAVKADEDNIGLLRRGVGYTQVVGVQHILQWLFANEIDQGVRKTASDV